MDVQRRRFITGIAGILVSAAAPAIITTPGLLMPVRKLIVPDDEQLVFFTQTITIDQMRGLYAEQQYWKRVIDATCGLPPNLMPIAPAGLFRDKA